jgi:hypothetical protein
VPEALGALTVALVDWPLQRPMLAGLARDPRRVPDDSYHKGRRALALSLTEHPRRGADCFTTTAATRTSPESSTESTRRVLADVMQVERVSVDSNFFDDLGADSMVMARFCARVRSGLICRRCRQGHLSAPYDRSLAAALAEPRYACRAGLRRHAG